MLSYTCVYCSFWGRRWTNASMSHETSWTQPWPRIADRGCIRVLCSELQPIRKIPDGPDQTSGTTRMSTEITVVREFRWNWRNHFTVTVNFVESIRATSLMENDLGHSCGTMSKHFSGQPTTLLFGYLNQIIWHRKVAGSWQSATLLTNFVRRVSPYIIKTTCFKCKGNKR